MKSFIEKNTKPALWCNSHTAVIEVQALEEYLANPDEDAALVQLPKGAGLYFSLAEFIVGVVLLIFISGSIGILLGQMYATSENHAKIMKCANTYGMNCTIIAMPSQ